MASGKKSAIPGKRKKRMAKPISPSYPVTGEQARDLIQEIDRVSKGQIDQAQKRKLEENADKAIRFFQNAASILSSKK